jgi:hypothetical protein
MTLQDAMTQATREICDEYGITPDRINEHNCFDWAFKVFNLVPGTMIGGHRIDGEGQSYIEYGGLCYDSECPEGRTDWWNLPTFRRMITGH